jgi:hypothetical protein
MSNTKYRKQHGILPRYNEWMLIGREMTKIQFWSSFYDFSFQFWGDGDNNVFIARDLVEVHSMGGSNSPLNIMQRTIAWCEVTNPSVTYPEVIDISNPQP